MEPGGKRMSTFMQKPAEVERKWYLIDAAGKPLGRTATQIAVLLRGKHKTTFTPHVDNGDYVVVINCSKAVLTGKKLEQKMYRRHSGWPGGLKETGYATIMERNPEKAMMLAVKGMLPNNKIGRKALTRLRAFAGEKHDNEAQKPEKYEG
jgi:large subunit ribosomal protein L13